MPDRLPLPTSETATYANLFTAIGTAYGSVDGTHFNVPDSRGRVLVGKGSNTAVSTLGNSDGVTVVSRRCCFLSRSSLSFSARRLTGWGRTN